MSEEVFDLIKKGQVFKAETVKGAKTLIYCVGRRQDGFVYFVHAGVHKLTGGARVTKHTIEQTVRAIESGDLEPVPREQVDWNRFIPSSLGLTAMSHGTTVEGYIDGIVDGSIAPEGSVAQ